ncbi:MAG TPA: VWA domain-containing protein, partial [Pirellulaceae bacterium]|nr:VWA domain-containing protein [Pirellulaceae bacterium]
MNLTLDLLSPVSLTAVFGLVGGLALALLVARLAVGPPAEIARRWGLLAIRGIVVVLLLLLLFNPVRVSESPGKIERPDVFYVMDASESMKMGGENGTRWEQAAKIIGEANEKTRDKTAADVKLFQFGNRLASVEGRGPALEVRDQGSEVRRQGSELGWLSGITPDDTDTRFQMALRQITSRFGRSPPASLVVFSDGRTRDAEGIEELAR